MNSPKEDSRKILEEAKKARSDKDYKEAEKLLLIVLSRKELTEEAHLEMGNILNEEGRKEQAGKEYGAVLDINPANSAAFSELAKILWLGPGRKELEKICTSTLTRDSKNAAAHLYLGKLYRMAGDYSRSLAELEEAFRLNRENRILGEWLREERGRTGAKNIIPPYRVYFTWGLLHECNYSCAYCYVPRSEKYAPVPADKIISAWENVFEKYGSCRIRLDGGEPSIYPGFVTMVKKISRFHKLQINTNLSFPAERFIKEIDPLRVRIDASFHPGQAPLQEFLEKAVKLKSKGFKVVAALVAYPATLKKIAEIRKAVETHGIPFLIHPYSGEYKGKIYPRDFTEEEKKLIYAQDWKSGSELEWRKEHKDDRFPQEAKGTYPPDRDRAASCSHYPHCHCHSIDGVPVAQ